MHLIHRRWYVACERGIVQKDKQKNVKSRLTKCCLKYHVLSSTVGNKIDRYHEVLNFQVLMKELLKKDKMSLKRILILSSECDNRCT